MGREAARKDRAPVVAEREGSFELADPVRQGGTMSAGEALYRDLVATSQEMIWRCDAEGRYFFLNSAWERVFGFPVREMLGRRPRDFQSPAQAERDRLEFLKLKPGKMLTGYRTVHMGKHGREIQLLLNAKAVVDRHGIVTGMSGTACDITERSMTEKLRKVFSNINTLIHSTVDFEEMLEEVIPEAANALGSAGAEFCALKEGRWTRCYDYGSQVGCTNEQPIEEEPHVALAIRMKEQVFTGDFPSDRGTNRTSMKQDTNPSVLAVPLITEKEVKGVISFFFPRDHFIREPQRYFTQLLAVSLALAMQKSLLLKDLQSQLAERTRVEQELLRAYDELERRVAVRTAELEASRRELEMQNEALQRTHHELEVSHDRYSNLYDHAPVPYITLDAGGIIREINLTGASLLGYDRQHLVDVPFVQYVDKRKSRLFYGHLQRCRKNSGQITSELCLSLRDGTLLQVLLQSVPEHRAGGEETYYRTAITDITEQKRTEENLLRMNRLYAVLSRTNEAIVRCADQDRLFRETCQICVTHGGFVMAWVGLADRHAGVVHPVAANGMGIEFIDGVTFSITDEPAGIGIVGSSVRRGDCFVCNDSTNEPGAPAAFRASAAFPLKLNGEPVGALSLYADEPGFFDPQMVELLQQMAANLSFALDNFDREARQWAAERALQKETSERLRTVEELREKERLLVHQSRQAAMGEMISNISHQWRQPLNVLGLVVQELPIRYEAGDLSREHLEASVAKAKQLIFHMSDTIDDFRNFFRPNKEKIAFRVYDVVEKTISLIDASFREHRIVIDLHADDDVYIEGYPNEFSQVVLNILLNARDAFVEHAVPSRRVQIWLLRKEGRGVVTIGDNAGGIPDTILPRIFDPYFSTKGPDKGTGLGLFMSKIIIEKNMNGRLEVRNLGSGAEFTITV